MDNKFKLHTAEELHQIAEHDFERFKEISKYYYENDFDYFETTILPIIDEHKHKKLIVSELSQSNAVSKSDDKIELHEIKNKENSPAIIHYNEVTENYPNKVLPKKKNNLLFYSLTAVILIAITILLYYFLIYNNVNRQAEKLLKEKKFDLALQKLNEIDSTSDNYSEIKSTVYYAKGGKAFEQQNYREASMLLSKVDNANEFYPDAKAFIDKINTDPNIIYTKGKNHLDATEFNAAQTEFQKLKTTDGYYNQAQSKINYIKGLAEFNLGNFEDAYNYFNNVDKTDETFPDILKKKQTINNYLTAKKDKENNKDYTQFLLRIADRIQDEYQSMTQNDTWLYIKNTYLKNLMELRTELNSYSYSVTNRDNNLVDFKRMILSWVNIYIKYGEDIGYYGYYSNYIGDNMWSTYEYILHKDKDDGSDLHQKVIKRYKEVRSQYALN